MPTLHIHVDDAGDLDFRHRGSRHYTFAAAWTYSPVPLADTLRRLRFALLRNGVNTERFHANPDREAIRRQVIAAMSAHLDWLFAALVVDKTKLYGSLQDPLRFYPRFLPMVLRFVFRGRIRAGTDRVLIYTDRLPINRRRKAVEKAIHASCASDMPDGITFHVFHHNSASNSWLQVADYCAWSVHRKHEHGNTAHYDALQGRMATTELYLWR